MRTALLAVAVVLLMIVSMLAVVSALPGNVIPAKNGTSPVQPHGYDRSGLQTSSSNAQSVPQANPSTNSGADKLDLLLHNYKGTAESPIQSNLLASYKVTFTETGLPAGMPWQVTVENSSFPLPPIFGAFFNMSLGGCEFIVWYVNLHIPGQWELCLLYRSCFYGSWALLFQRHWSSHEHRYSFPGVLQGDIC